MRLSERLCYPLHRQTILADLRRMIVYPVALSLVLAVGLSAWLPFVTGMRPLIRSIRTVAIQQG